VLRSAIIALQCRRRVKDAKKLFDELKKEHKDVGKLKGMNDKLKEEMASLRAMLAAQAKESAANEEHDRALAEKQKIIDDLEKRIAEIEKELAAAKAKVSKLEADLSRQFSESQRDKEQINQLQKSRSSASPHVSSSHRKTPSNDGIMRRRPSTDAISPLPSSVPADYVSPEMLAQHRSRVAKLEEELEGERRLRREADGEIIKLRAAANGVKLDEGMISDLLSQGDMTRSEESSFAADESPSKLRYVVKKSDDWSSRCALGTLLSC